MLHDWDKPECKQLVLRFAKVTPATRRLLIHNVSLNDKLDGPLPIAIYSAALYVETEGRPDSAKEYQYC